MAKVKKDLVREDNHFYFLSRKDVIAYLQAIIDDAERELGDMGEPVEVIDLSFPSGLAVEQARELLKKLKDPSE